MPVPGTDIGRALNEAYRAMDKGSRRKMVVLVTDGEGLEKSGIAAAKNLATNGVVVFTIGVGTPAGKEVQFVNPAGQPEAGAGRRRTGGAEPVGRADTARNRPGHRRQLFRSARWAKARRKLARPFKR